MTDLKLTDTDSIEENASSLKNCPQLAKRHKKERRFRLCGGGAIAVALICLSALFITIFSSAYSALWQHEITLSLELKTEDIAPTGDISEEGLAQVDYQKIIRKHLRAEFPEKLSRKDKRRLNGLFSNGAGFELRQYVLNNPERIGQTIQMSLPVSDDVDMYMKGAITPSSDKNARVFNVTQAKWVDHYVAKGQIKSRFNWRFFTSNDSREPELAGVWGAALGSIYTLFICFLFSFPIGVMSAVYLEEMASRNRFTKLIEVNINNLAAVPSIVFGLLGLAVFLNVMELPRSAPLVGGMVLSLMTLPTIIISTRSALMAVPPSIREAALGLGASPLQVVFHHTVPLAMPGILTGTIIGMARALGETAPLLMIGMVAFVADTPAGLTEPASVLPVQVFLWADSPERAFAERTSAAIIILLLFLISMNFTAVLLRKKFEKRW